jgi:myo-inositol-1-phosphate synthase
MSAVFDADYVRNITGPNVKKADTKYDLALALMDDIEKFKKDNGCSRIVLVWCASTEKYIEISDSHKSLELFEIGLKTMMIILRPA